MITKPRFKSIFQTFFIVFSLIKIQIISDLNCGFEPMTHTNHNCSLKRNEKHKDKLIIKENIINKLKQLNTSLKLVAVQEIDEVPQKDAVNVYCSCAFFLLVIDCTDYGGS